MSYTPPTYVDTKAQAILALASVVADEDKTALGNGTVNGALDVLADVLSTQDVQVPQTNAGAILALAQYAHSGSVLSEVYANEIPTGTRQREYYSGSVGGTVTTTSSSNSDGYIIDLAAYAGKPVVVHFDGTGTSSRSTLLCDGSGTIYQAMHERYIRKRGFTVYPTEAVNKLYISYTTALTTNLHVYALDNLYGMASDGAWDNPIVAYVSQSGSDSGYGTVISPFASIQKAIDSGAERILVREGTYAAFRVAYTNYPVYIGPWVDYSSTTTMPEPLITIHGTGTDNLVHVFDCYDVALANIYADSQNGTTKPFVIDNCRRISMKRCVACNSTADETSGFRFINSSGTLDSCEAFSVTLDGYNFHGHGTTTLINCIAHDCGDDGVSHHDACRTTIIGGEYYHCQKGGVSTPTYGASGYVIGAYAHDNTKYGIYVTDDASGVACNCACKDNGTADIAVNGTGTLIGWGNKYDTVSVADTATFVNLDAS